MDEHISNSQAQQLQRLRDLLGEAAFQEIQRDVWKQFSPKVPPLNGEGTLAPLALFAIWDELFDALQAAEKKLMRDQEDAAQMKPADRLLWQLLKNGVPWAATLTFRRTDQRWEVVITRNRHRTRVQQFVNREKAEAWADDECTEIAMGWKA